MELADAKLLPKGSAVTIVIPNSVRYHAKLEAAGVNGKGEVFVKVGTVVTNTSGRRIKKGKTRYVSASNIRKS